MKNITTRILILICFIGISASLSAQKLTKKFSFGLGTEVGLTTGDFKNTYQINGGLTLRLSFHAGPGFATLTSGVIAFLPKSFNNPDLKAGVLVPVRAGYKYINHHFFAMGEIGYGSFISIYKDANDDIQKSTTGGFLFAPSAGVQFGTFEVGLRYESVSLSGVNLSDFGLRLGFNF